MDTLVRESKTSTFFSITTVLAGAWTPDKGQFLNFQRALLENGLEFSQSVSRENGFQLRRGAPSSPLQVTVEGPAPQVHSLQILAANPVYDLEVFCRDAEAAMSAYQATWPADTWQVLNTSAKICHLYSSRSHTFQYLWEVRLGQSSEDFRRLGNRPVSGGGLRLVMPPHSVDGQEPVSIELRLESFLREPTRLLVETTFTWPRPRTVMAGQRFEPARYLEAAEQFAANDVWEFLVQRGRA
jgi:hypothetical protein